MGCGKSTVSRLLVRAGFEGMDSDALIRDRVLPSTEVQQELRNHFGSGVFTDDGQLDRRLLAGRIFADDAERQWLEALTHPRLFAVWREELQAKPAARWCFEVPLLFEKQLENWFDFTVCVASAPEQQLTRLEQRGIPRELAGARISKQLPLAQKIELSDFVIWNNGPINFLQAQVDRLIAVLPAGC